MNCPKCKAKDGNDWTQCQGKCPVPGSPHYDQELHLSLVELTNFQKKVFAIFVRSHSPGYWHNGVQLEGDKRLSIVRAGLRLADKGLVLRVRSCFWVLTKAGTALSEQWQKDKVLEKRLEEKKRTGIDPWA